MKQAIRPLTAHDAMTIPTVSQKGITLRSVSVRQITNKAPATLHVSSSSFLLLFIFDSSILPIIAMRTPAPAAPGVINTVAIRQAKTHQRLFLRIQQAYRTAPNAMTVIATENRDAIASGEFIGPEIDITSISTLWHYKRGQS